MILRQCPIDLRLYILLCSDLALRSGSAVRVAPCHRVDGTVRLDHVKHGKNIALPVTAEIAAIFDMVETNPNCDRQMSYLEALRVTSTTRRAVAKSLANHYTNRLKHVCGKLGIENLRTHDFRRTTAERVYTETRDLRLVQALLGHSHLNITSRYLMREQMKPSLQLLEKVKSA